MAPSGWNLVQSGKAGKQHQAKLSGKAPGGAKAIRRASPLSNDHLSQMLGDSRVMAKAFKRWQQACWGNAAHLSSEAGEACGRGPVSARAFLNGISGCLLTGPAGCPVTTGSLPRSA